MAGSFTDFLENELLDHVFGAAAYTAPATLHIALGTAGIEGSFTEVNAAVWTNYARVAVTNNATNFPAASGGAKANGTDIDFGTATMATPGTDTVAVTDMAIFDDPTAGNRLAWADLTVPKTVNHGDPVKIPAGDLDITLD